MTCVDLTAGLTLTVYFGRKSVRPLLKNKLCVAWFLT